MGTALLTSSSSFILKVTSSFCADFVVSTTSI